ncbi:MAG TPA: fibro-slime domain-containing protein [Polyangiaceae bacterium]|nr:fibro-slime domain-containing protein [Polyangiaceae bacterium]
MRFSFFTRAATLALGMGMALTGAASCGRTGLWMADPCDDEGAERNCSDTCGGGVEVCEEGLWSECRVPKAERDCRTICGQGTQSCEHSRWGACEVPPVDFPCDNLCGAGVQHCADGRMGNCDVPPVSRDCESGCGTGHETCTNGAWQPCDAPQPNPPVLHTVLRDFSPATSPDFEFDRHGIPGDEPFLVKDLLGPDDKPEWSGDPSIHTVQSKETFDTWYRDTPGINAHIDYDLALEASATKPGFFVYDNLYFFPLDNDPRGFGNEGRQHDYHFTLEAKLTFRYAGGEIFSFTGDDDMWVFINRHLAINLGGLHPRKSASVSLDERALSLEISHGEIYPIHIFFAERHTVSSTFTLETSVADQGSCPQ